MQWKWMSHDSASAKAMQTWGICVLCTVNRFLLTVASFWHGKQVEWCWVFGGVKQLETNSDNPFQQEHFAGSENDLGNLFAIVVEKCDAWTLIPTIQHVMCP